MPISYEHIREELNPTPGEGQLLDGANTAQTAEINQTRIIATLYANKAIYKLIESNEKLSKSNNRYASALNWLTAGLLIVAAVQVYLLVSGR